MFTCKIGLDTAENEPFKVFFYKGQKLPENYYIYTSCAAQEVGPRRPRGGLYAAPQRTARRIASWRRSRSRRGPRRVRQGRRGLR